MPTPLVHSAVGYAFFRSARTGSGSPAPHARELVGFIAAANAADVDFIPGVIVGAPTAYHHYATHSIAAAVVIGLLAYRLVRSRWRALVAVALTHPLLDLCTADTYASYSQHHGIPLLWPFSAAQQSAVLPLFSAPYVGGELSKLFGAANAITLARDLVAASLIVGFAAILRRFVRDGELTRAGSPCGF